MKKYIHIIRWWNVLWRKQKRGKGWENDRVFRRAVSSRSRGDMDVVVNSASVSQLSKMGSLWVFLALPSGSLHTFTFHPLLPLSPKPSTLYWLGSRIKSVRVCTWFWSSPLHWASSCCQNNLSKTKICSCFPLAVNLSLVFISYRVESLILGEIFSSLYCGSLLPFPVLSPAHPWWIHHVLPLYPSAHTSCFSHSEHFSHSHPQIPTHPSGSNSITRFREDFLHSPARTVHVPPSSSCSMAMLLLSYL